MKPKKKSKSLQKKEATLTNRVIQTYKERVKGKKISVNSNSKEILIPFDNLGNQLFEPLPQFKKDAWGRLQLDMNSIVWKNPIEFEDTLEILELNRGRSAVNFTCNLQNNLIHCYLTISELLKIMKETVIKNGKIKGRWTYKQHGRYYSIRFLGSIE